MPQSPSHSADSGIGKTRRRSLEDGKTILSSHSTNPKEDAAVVPGDVKPDPGSLSNSAQLPKTNGLGRKRKVLKNEDEDLENQGRPVVTKPQNVEAKLESRRKRKVTPVGTLQSPEESSSEDGKPIR